jgi:hypothetical protein
MPGRGGAVTGGTLDQSTFAPGGGVAAPAGGAVVGATVVLPAGAGGGSAAKTWKARLSAPMPVQSFDNEPRGVISDVLGKVFAWGRSMADEAGQLGRFMAGSLRFYMFLAKKFAGNYSRIRTLFEQSNH